MKLRIFHILVKHEYEAQDLYKRIKSFNEFKTQAQKYSLCSSAPYGGDLGEVDTAKIDEDFLNAYKLLKTASWSKPVRTRFGWHLIYKKD